MVFTFGQYKVDIDVNQTRQFYKNARLISEGCSCGGCRNYERAVSELPVQMTEFFTDIGIDMRKACEVYVNCGNSDGTLFYGGFYHVCGTVLSGISAWTPTGATISHWEQEQAFPVVNGFNVSFQSECDMLEQEFPLPVIQLEISANVPWVLPEKSTYLI